MAKTPKGINAYDGGLVTFINAKDVKDNECTDLKNFSVRQVGSLRVLGEFQAIPGTISTIAEATGEGGASGDDIQLRTGAKFFTYSTDYLLDGTTSSAEVYILYADPTDGRLYIHDKTNNGWQSVSSKSDGIPGALGAGLTAGDNMEASYYFADGGLRICDANFSTGYTSSVSSSSSILLKHVNRSFLNGDVVVEGWWCNPTKIEPPLFSSNVVASVTIDAVGTGYTVDDTITVVNTGTGGTGFACHVSAVNTGGITAIEIDNAGSGYHSPPTLTAATGGADATLTAVLNSGASFANGIFFNTGPDGQSVQLGQFGLSIDINRDIGDGSMEMQGRKIYATFTYDNAQESLPKEIGMITALDIATLAPAPTEALLGYIANATSAAGVPNYTDFGATTLHVAEKVHDHESAADEKKNWENAGMVQVEDSNGQLQTLSYSDIVDGSTTNGNNGGADLLGVAGWVDTGYCSLSYSLENITVGAQGSGYTNGEVWITTDGAPDDAATGTISVTGGAVTAFNISNHGSGYTTAPTTISITSSGTSATAVGMTITSEMTSKLECEEHGGTWNDGNIADAADVEYDPPGEIEVDDENLAIRPALTCRALTTGSNGELLQADIGGNRVTHVNIYSNKFTDDSGTIPETSDYVHLASFDTQNGFQKSDGSFIGWSADATQGASNQLTTKGDFITTSPSENFQMRTGMFPDTWDTHIRWRTATVLNRRVYAGNVEMKERGNDSYSQFPDRIIKSLPNQFDNFPTFDILDVVVDDGDEIVALDNFGGQLLQFKKKTLYIIDVTSEPEFLKAKHRYRGIPSQSAYAVTDGGVLFGNRYGAFFYNGESIQELSQMKIEDRWDTFYEDSLCVGFHPNTKQGFFYTDSSTEFFIYDIGTQSWTTGDGARFTTNDKSNFFQYENEVVVGFEGADGGDGNGHGPIAFYKWSNSLASSIDADYLYKSREIDFDSPATDKRIYKVYITYKSSATPNTKVSFLANDGTGEITIDVNEVLGSTSGDWKNVELTPLGGSFSAKSLKLQIADTGGGDTLDKDFELNDITVVYKEKRVK